LPGEAGTLVGRGGGFRIKARSCIGRTPGFRVSTGGLSPLFFQGIKRNQSPISQGLKQLLDFRSCRGERQSLGRVSTGPKSATSPPYLRGSSNLPVSKTTPKPGAVKCQSKKKDVPSKETNQQKKPDHGDTDGKLSGHTDGQSQDRPKTGPTGLIQTALQGEFARHRPEKRTKQNSRYAEK